MTTVQEWHAARQRRAMQRQRETERDERNRRALIFDIAIAAFVFIGILAACGVVKLVSWLL
jgi:hypothetical protein